MRSHYTHGGFPRPYDEMRLCDTFPDSMRSTFVACLAATAIAFAAFAGSAFQGKLAAAATSHGDRAIWWDDARIGAQLQQNDGDLDKTEMILLTLAASGAAAVLAVIGYFIRLRIGYFPHRPPPRDGNAAQDHH